MKKHIIYLSVLMLMGACSTPKYVATPAEFKYQVKGLYIDCKLEGKPDMIGEIIEVNYSTIKLLPLNQTGGITIISKGKIQKANVIVALTSDNPTKIRTWASLINIASLGHGVFAAISLPVNLAVTIPMISKSGKGVYSINYPENVKWKDLSKFARFPQGIPESINQHSIK